MGLAHSPRIVTDNLIQCFDAGNVKSYPGSGSTWTDLSPRAVDGTIYNSPTFSSNNNGLFVFDGSNDKVSIPDSTDFEFGSGDFTVEAWVKQSNSAGTGASAHTIVNKWDNTSNAKEILQLESISGLLVGGASLDEKQFLEIIG